ncbi:MAG TPA: hypothetical protein VEA69_00660 [Tepidisphaeraceae bacterium]|nr:hypothetical protein [Tepidisphaeraceae bacterium]
MKPFLLAVVLLTLPARAYNPFAIPANKPPEPIDLTVKDSARARDIPIRVMLPHGKEPAPVLLFSHGLGGSRNGPAYLGEHWVARGYAVVYIQHPGSDVDVWKGKPLGERAPALRQAASAHNFSLRVKDVPAVIDQLEVWNKETEHPLCGRLDLSRLGMSGHSFGAVTTQAVSGQSFPGNVAPTDARIKAAIPLSPSSPRAGDPARAFGAVKIPWLLMTGTQDTSPIGDIDVKSRLAVFPALPAGGKYELVLDAARHSAFGDSLLPGDLGAKRNPNHHKAILALSTAFWDAYLRGVPEAKQWLDGDGPRTVLEKADTWQTK